jgi:hypothetical protein
MKSTIVAVLCIAAFAMRTSGQTTTTYDTGIGHGTPPIPTVNSELPNTLPPLVITSDYYAHPKVLVLHALNNSGKDITGYTIIIRHKNPDGTIDNGGRTENTSDMLSVLITSQMAKDPSASERILQQNIGNGLFPAGTGIFVAGETRDMTLTGIDSGSQLDIAAGAVFYVDGTYDQQDEDAFKRLLAVRQGQLQQTKEANELMRNALADPTNDHPVAAVLTELNKRRAEAMDKPGQGFFWMDLSNLKSMQQPQTYGEQKGKTERERSTQYVEEQEKKVELMTPHCHLEIALKAVVPDSAK